MQRWHAFRLDAAILILVALILATALPAAHSTDETVSALLSAASLAVFLARRWQRLAVCVLSFGCLPLGASLTLRLSPLQFLGILLVFGMTGGINRLRDAVLGLIAGGLAIAYVTSLQPANRLSEFFLTFTFCTILWAAGVAVANRGRRLELAEERAREAERTRLEHARRATESERARIATELHDIVSHGLSVVIVQTVAARQSLAGLEDASTIDLRLEAVEETAREALSDMRRMLGLLELPAAGDQESTAPVPSLKDLPGLVERARSAGLHVESPSLDAALGPMQGTTPGLELAAYRIVQESLTNVLKHAPDATVRLRVARTHHTLDIELLNSPSSPSSPDDEASAEPGHGLIGIRQRCELFGGHCESGPRADGGFGVHAVLPLSVDHISAHEAMT